jgi:hypothetical protein
MWKWIKDEWHELQWHAKWELIKWAVPLCIAGVAALIAFAIHWIQALRHAPQQDLLGYIILAVLIVIALSLFVVIVMPRRSSSIQNAIISSPPEIEQASQPELKEHPPAPLPTVDLRGSIEGLYFLRPSGFPLISNYKVYVKLRITNHGPDEAVITRWTLHIIIGDDKVQGPATELPANLAIQRQDFSALYVGTPNFKYEPVQPDLTKVPTSDPYRKGIPKDGWVQFEPLDYGSAPSHNGGFYIALEDSLGNTHWIFRKAQSYKMDGELVEISEPSLKALGSGG